jgi:hypothetical protein
LVVCAFQGKKLNTKDALEAILESPNLDSSPRRSPRKAAGLSGLKFKPLKGKNTAHIL